jgi:hypothetical protein
MKAHGTFHNNDMPILGVTGLFILFCVRFIRGSVTGGTTMSDEMLRNVELTAYLTEDSIKGVAQMNLGDLWKQRGYSAIQLQL